MSQKPKDAPPLSKKVIEKVNAMLGVPREIRCDDGRELIVTHWQPRWQAGEGTTSVLLEVIVRMPAGKE